MVLLILIPTQAHLHWEPMRIPLLGIFLQQMVELLILQVLVLSPSIMWMPTKHWDLGVIPLTTLYLQIQLPQVQGPKLLREILL